MKRTERARRTSRFRRGQVHQRQALGWQAFNSLAGHIAVLDNQGVVQAVNRAWTRFAEQNDGPGVLHASVGTNYFEICRAAEGAEAATARQALDGILGVLEGRIEDFEFEYPFDSPAEKRWYVMRVTRLTGPQDGLVISHWSTTSLRGAQMREAQAEAAAAGVEEREQELSALSRMSEPPRLLATSRSFGLAPLSESFPELLEDIAGQYRELLEQALEQRAYRVENPLADGLRRLAEQLGFLLAGPRDVVEMHTRVMRELIDGAPAEKAQAYVQEGRLAVLEIMGHLLNYYRHRAVPARREAPVASSRRPDQEETP